MFFQAIVKLVGFGVTNLANLDGSAKHLDGTLISAV